MASEDSTKQAGAAQDEGFQSENLGQTQGWFGNIKRTYDEYQDIALTSARRSQAHFDDLNSRNVNSLDTLLGLQARINEEHFASLHELRKHLANIQTDRQRHADIWAYEAAYDLGNPVTTGAGDTLRSAAYTPNRAADVASAGVGVSAEAVAAAVAKSVNDTITAELSVLAATVQSLVAAVASIANVLTQIQPKTPAAA